jgi:hypothetical protein
MVLRRAPDVRAGRQCMGIGSYERNPGPSIRFAAALL